MCFQNKKFLYVFIIFIFFISKIIIKLYYSLDIEKLS